MSDRLVLQEGAAIGSSPTFADRQNWLISLQRFTKPWLVRIGIVVVLLVLVIAVTAPWISPYDPLQQAIAERMRPPLWTGRWGLHPLGTDHLGRDVLSRIFYGARISIVISFGGTLVAAAVGTVAGLVAGFAGGWVDDLVMRLVDLQLTFPFILLALAVLALLGASELNIISVLALSGWPIYARTGRASVLSLKETTWVEAAKCIGVTSRRILFRHILPNAASPLIVVSSFQLAQMIILESALGFLGLGIQPPTPTWGNMLADGRAYITDSWWLPVFPGLAIVLTAAGINFVGDGLRHALDPRASEY